MEGMSVIGQVNKHLLLKLLKFLQKVCAISSKNSKMNSFGITKHAKKIIEEKNFL